MTSNSLKQSPYNVNNLISALAEKGTPGIILLGLIFLIIWAPVGVIVWGFFNFLGTAKDFSTFSSLNPFVGIVIVGVLLSGYLFLAYRLTCKIMESIIPTIQAETEIDKLMSGVVGGRVLTMSGTMATIAIDKHGAEVRVKQIMHLIVERAKNVLNVELVRSNIFTLMENGELKILNNYHINMEGPMVGSEELNISIPPGLLSSGWAYKYFRPVVSFKKSDGTWPHSSQNVQGWIDIQRELGKAHPDLSWIISMPIPYQVQPFKLVSGVLNVDGLKIVPTTEQMRYLLTDISIAAALIAVINRSTGFLVGQYTVPTVPVGSEQEDLKGFALEPEEFDPTCCPEPSGDFILALSRIAGLEFFSRISPAQVANYLRDQLQS